MGQKDITEKILEAYNDVFADIVNVLLFDGKEIIRPDELQDQSPRSYYKVDGQVREIERDVAKRWKKQNIRIACIGFENQTSPDPDMPLRVIGYDGAEYRTELNGQDRYPVVTLVLYFGHKKHWDQPVSLLDCFDIPEIFRPYVNDYRINLFEIAYLTQEQVRLFKSDFRIVADYFVQMQQHDDYIPSDMQIQHVQEVLQLLSVMTGDHRFEESYHSNSKGGTKTMCEVLDRVERRGIAIGEARGISIGEARGISIGEARGISIGEARGISIGEATGFEKSQRIVAHNMKAMGMTDEVIAKSLNATLDQVRQWLAEPIPQ